MYVRLDSLNSKYFPKTGHKVGHRYIKDSHKRNSSYYAFTRCILRIAYYAFMYLYAAHMMLLYITYYTFMHYIFTHYILCFFALRHRTHLHITQLCITCAFLCIYALHITHLCITYYAFTQYAKHIYALRI